MNFSNLDRDILNVSMDFEETVVFPKLRRALERLDSVMLYTQHSLREDMDDMCDDGDIRNKREAAALEAAARRAINQALIERLGQIGVVKLAEQLRDEMNNRQGRIPK